MTGSVYGFTNQGTIEASNGCQAVITLDQVVGPVSFTNTGTIETIGPGSFISINGDSTPFTNSGQLIVDGGTIVIADSVVGGGRATIENGGTLLVISGEFGSVIHFAPNAEGTLEFGLDDPEPTITGIVSGFAAGDTISVIGPWAGTTVSYAPNSANNGGLLTITNGAHNAVLTLAGNYDPIGFHFWQGDITYAPPPSKAEFYNASQAVYHDNPNDTLISTAPPPLTGLKVLLDSKAVDPGWLSDGFFGQAFQDKAGNIIIAFEGSILDPKDPAYSTTFGAGSRAADLALLKYGLGLPQTPAAFSDALVFVSQVESEFGSKNVYLTGHSLGGAEAEFVASQTGLNGVTFGAPGVLPNSVMTSSFLNYVDYGDPVGNFWNHYGLVAHVGSPANAAVLTIDEINALETGLLTLADAVTQYHPLAHYAAELQLHLLSGQQVGGFVAPMA